MKNKVIWLGLSFLLAATMLLASCAKSTTTSTPTSTTTSTTKTSTTTKTTTTTNITTTTAPTTTAATGHWWDKLGTPQYGGEMNLRLSNDIVSFDPYDGEYVTQVFTGWMEQLFVSDWTMDPAVQPYQLSFWDNSFARGGLLKSWEFTAPGVFVMHVRPGIYWQNIAPANGREFTASDIAFHFNRLFGLGDGFTTPAPFWNGIAQWKSLTSITAQDKYTVIMQWNTPNPELVTENLEMPDASTSIENPEAVKQWGNLNDWHHAIGTGSFILSDFVSGGSATLVKNPNYWGYDERYPQNKLPYLNKISVLVIVNNATAMAAMRTGKIDVMDQTSVQDAKSMQTTNPEILQIPIPQGNAVTIDPRDDLAPFSDVRVRKALQMAINLPEIANTLYGGTCLPYPSPLTSNYMTGWGFPYTQWPDDLKAEYAYNPTAAKKLLADAGVTTPLHINCVTVDTNDMNLLLAVKSYFTDINVDMSITQMDLGSFTNFVVTNHKNDGLAVRQNGAGSLGLGYYPLRQFSKFLKGASANIAMFNDPIYNDFYPASLAATSSDGLKTILTNCNKYVAQQHVVISLLQPIQYSLCQPWLKGYNSQYGATYSGSGPLILYFYGARFWVDQNLKRSMGH